MASNHHENKDIRDAAVALAALSEPGAPLTERCPTLEQISAWHETALPRNEAEFVKIHVARCDQCFDLWSGILEALDDESNARHNVVPLKTRRLRRPFLALAATVLSIAILIPLLLNRAPNDLPAYQVRVNQSATLRGEQAEPTARTISLASGDQFELLFVPATTVTGSVNARASLRQGDGWQLLDAPPLIDQARGVLEISGKVGTTITFPRAHNELLVAVGRSEHLPDAESIDRTMGSRANMTTPLWTAWRLTVVVTPDN